MLLFPGKNQQCSRDEVTFRTHSVILRELSDSLRMRQHVLGAAKRDVAMILLVDVRFCNEKHRNTGGTSPHLRAEQLSAMSFRKCHSEFISLFSEFFHLKSIGIAWHGLAYLGALTLISSTFQAAFWEKNSLISEFWSHRPITSVLMNDFQSDFPIK